MNFADLIPDKILTDTLGDDMTYHAKTGPVAIKAMVSDFIEPVFSGEAHLSEKRKQMNVAMADVPGIKKESKFTYAGKKYLVDDIIANDGHFITLVLRS